MPAQRQVDGGGLRAFEVDPSFVPTHIVEIGPQSGPGGEYLSPSPAYVGQRDYVSIFMAPLPTIVQIVRNEREYFGGDSVDRCDGVPPGLN